MKDTIASTIAAVALIVAVASIAVVAFFYGMDYQRERYEAANQLKARP